MRRALVVLVCALLVGSVLASVSGSTTTETGWTVSPVEDLPGDRTLWWPDETDLVLARESAFEWLDGQQSQDGGFSEDYGVTALVAFAMMNGGRDAEHQVVAKALAHVLAEAREDGSFSEGTYVHYYTSLAVMALAAGGASEDERLVSAGVDMLVREQCDGDEEGFEEWWRGGIGYGGDGRPDMSNTQFALMALTAAVGAYPSIEVPQETWDEALVFLHRCQNLPGVNDLDWDDQNTGASYGDGGFVYHPGRSNAGGLKSYGSMTAAGLWCMLAAGETTDSTASAAALSWLASEFSATENPGIGDAGYYYYVWAAARALRTAGAYGLTSPQGTQMYWACQLSESLLESQAVTGHWQNLDSDKWWEGDAVVSTCFAVLALEAMMPAEDAGLRIRATDGTVLRVVDTLGRENDQIPGWSEELDGTVVLRDASLGPFSVEATGPGNLEVGSQVDGTVKVWREVGLSTEGSSMTVDVAPLLGPASIVIANMGALPASSAASSTASGPSAGMAMAAVAVLAAVSALTVRRRART